MKSIAIAGALEILNRPKLRETGLFSWIFFFLTLAAAKFGLCFVLVDPIGDLEKSEKKGKRREK